MTDMTGNLLGSRMARLEVQNTWFGIAQCQKPISRQAGGVLFENSARCTNSPVPREREPMGVFVHIHVGVEETEIPRERDRDSEKQKEMI